MNTTFRDNIVKPHIKNMSREDLRHLWRTVKSNLYKRLVVGNTIEAEINSITPSRFIITKINHSTKHKNIIKSVSGRGQGSSYISIIPISEVILKRVNGFPVNYDDYVFPIKLAFMKYLI